MEAKLQMMSKPAPKRIGLHVIVTSCRDCPALETNEDPDRCGLDKPEYRGITDDQFDTVPPAWCPLRVGVALIELQEIAE